MEERSSDVQESKSRPKPDSGPLFRSALLLGASVHKELETLGTSCFPTVAHFSGLLENETKVHHLSKSRKHNAGWVSKAETYFLIRIPSTPISIFH